MLILLFWCFLTVAGIYFVVSHKRKSVDLPGPPPWPLIGNLDLIWFSKKTFTETLYDLVSESQRKFQNASFWVLHISYLKYVFLCKHEDIETVFKNGNLFVKSDDFKLVSKYLGDGILTSEGQKWKTRRKLHNPFFASTSLRELTSVLNQTAERVVKHIKDAEPNTFIDVNSMVRHFVVEAACKSFFDYTPQGKPLDRKVEELLHTADKLLCEKVLVPLYWIDWIHHKTKNGRKLVEFATAMREFVNSLIEWRESLQDEVRDGLRRKTLLDGFIEAYSNNLITKEGIAEEMATVLIAAHDTTAFTLTMALSSLGNHEEAQEGIVKELNEILEHQSVNRMTTEQVNQLVYTEAVIKETLRQYPPGLLVPRRATDSFELNGNTFPKNTVVGIAQLGLSLNSNNFEEPECFKPERFLDENCNVKNVKNFFPFGCGPRGCIGQRFAMNEMKVLLAHILSQYRLKAERKTSDIALEFNMTQRTLSEVKIMFSSQRLDKF